MVVGKKQGQLQRPFHLVQSISPGIEGRGEYAGGGGDARVELVSRHVCM